MKKRNRCLVLGLLAMTLAPVAFGDDIAGLWIYESFERPQHGVKPLVGLFLFHDGQFIHQAMHGGEPMEQQLTDAHIGKYRIRSEGVVGLDVETGIVVTPAGKTLLAGRSNTSHDVNYELSDDNLFLSFANGATEKLVKVPTTKTKLIGLDRGMLALTDEHFVLVTEPEGGWLAGSGRYEKNGTSLRLEAMRWFDVRGDQASYAADQTFEATFDGKILRLPEGQSFQVTK